MLQNFADWLIYSLLGMAEGAMAEALDFFVYESIKIILLLFAVSMVMGIINAYFPIERLRKYLSTHRLYGFQYVAASVFGAITPFCSCSSIPLFIGFVRGGLPLGITFAFLITSPLVNEVAVAMFLGSFGWKATMVYVVSGVALGVIGGFTLSLFRLERYLSPWVLKMKQAHDDEAAQWQQQKVSFFHHLPAIVQGSLKIVKGVIWYVVIGIAIGAGIHGYVPSDFFATHLSSDSWYAVPLAVILAMPMYANAAGIVPVVQVLVAKGVSLGTAIAFMVSVVGLSLPEATMLKKVMSWRLIIIFFGTVAFFIILSGYIFNLLLT